MELAARGARRGRRGSDAPNMGWNVTVKVAHENPLPLRLTRAGYCSSLAALLILFGCECLQNATAEGETRTISFHHIHTSEDLTITYKVNGRYDENALTKINSLLRDWREDEANREGSRLVQPPGGSDPRV